MIFNHRKCCRIAQVLRALLTSYLIIALLTGCQENLTPERQLLSQYFPLVKSGELLSIRFSVTNEDPVLIKISGWETSTIASVRDQDNNTVNLARVEYRRGVPLYLIVEPNTSANQYRLEIEVKLATHESSIKVDISHLPLNNLNDDKRLTAYSLYSDSVQSDPSMELTLWSRRMENLLQATILFDDIGLQEERLWSEFLAAAIRYHPIADTDTSLAEAVDIAKRATSLNHVNVAVMAMQLHGQNLMWRGSNESSASAKESLNSAKTVFQQAINYAAAKRQSFQHAWALNNLAIAYHYSGEFSSALEQYQAALKVATPMRDPYLEQIIKSNMTAAYMALGEFFPALDLLRAATHYQRQEDQLTELGFSLDRMGDIYTQLYQFHPAIDAYFEALEIAATHEDTETTGLWQLSLGHAFYELGYMERALEYIRESIIHLEQMNAGTGLFLAHGVSAGIHRFLGEYPLMRTHRQRQGGYLTSDLQKASYEFDLGKDAIAEHGSPSSIATSHFASSLRLANSLDNMAISQLSQLYLCKIKKQNQTASPGCTSPELEESYLNFKERGSPRNTFEATLVWAEILASDNKLQAAVQEMNGLVNEITYYRTHIPGVMGAWYWQSRSRIFSTTMGLQLTLDRNNQASTESFLLLDRLRNIELTRNLPTQTDTHERYSIDIRSLLARVENAKTPDELTADRRKLEQMLFNRPTSGIRGNINKNPQTLEKLKQLLPGDTAVLTYYFSAEGVFAWVIDKTKTRLFQLTTRPDVVQMLRSTLENIRVIGHSGLENELDELGKLLVKPLASILPDTIYFIPGGPFNGFPFESLRHRGQYLAETHAIINLASIDALESLSTGWLEHFTPDHIFLSGGPDQNSSMTPALQGSLTELDTIESILSASIITKITGDKFTHSNLDDDTFRSADLIHIASHAVLNMSYPELSKLSLSSPDPNDKQFLTPTDVAGLNLAAKLVVLSACETTGVNSFRFDNNLGFVTELLASGADAVITSLFPVSDKASAEFMSDFYTELARSGNVKQALVKTKRNHLMKFPVRDWAAFQMTTG